MKRLWDTVGAVLALQGRSCRGSRSSGRARPWRRRSGRTARRRAARRCGCRAAAAASRPARRRPPSRAPSGSPWARQQRVDASRAAARAGCSRRCAPAASPVLQLGDRGPGALQQRRRLGRIELRGRAVSEARLGDLQRLLLDRDVLLGLRDQHLEGADDDVGPRDLRGQRDEGRVVVGDRRRAGWRPPPPRPAGTCPRSPAPTRRRNRADSPEVAREVGDVDDVLAEPDRGRAGDGRLDLRDTACR